jgi:hypothetical protein
MIHDDQTSTRIGHRLHRRRLTPPCDLAAEIAHYFDSDQNRGQLDRLVGLPLPQCLNGVDRRLICVKSWTVRFVWNGGGAMEYLEIMFYVAMGIAVIFMTASMWALLRWR